jgi:hypothetical protein
MVLWTQAALADFVDSAKLRQERAELGAAAVDDEAAPSADGGSPQAVAGRVRAPAGCRGRASSAARLNGAALREPAWLCRGA